MSLSNAPTSPNVNENWLFQFTADNDNCMVFNDGDNNYLNFGDIFNSFDDSTDGFTIEFWYQLSVTGANPILSFGYNDSPEAPETNIQFNVSIASGDTIKLSWEHDSGTGKYEQHDMDTGTNVWTHLAISRSNSDGKTRFYKNGAIVHTTGAESEDPTGGTSSNMEFLVGRNQNYGVGNYFEGKMAHLRVWSTIRSDVEIARYYQRTVDNRATGLLGYWKLDEGTGDTVYDSSSSSNNGAVMNNNKVAGPGSASVWGNGDFDKYIHSFGLAFQHTKVSSNPYYGTVLNRSITLRDSLDPINGTASTGNISVTAANFMFENDDFYKYLFNHAERNYHNREVRVFAQFNNEDTLSNCQRIFTGRLVEVTLNQDKTVTMQINTHRPWIGISFPQDQAENSNIYVPTVYGAFTPNESNVGTAAVCGFDLFPVPVIDVNDDKIITLMPRSYSSGSNSHINLWVGGDKFIPAAKATSSYDEEDATIIRGGNNVIVTPTSYYFHGIVDATESEPTTTNTLFTDAYKAYDGNTTTSATATLSASDQQASAQFTGCNNLFYAQFTYEAIVKFKYSVTGDINVYLESDAWASSFAGTVNVTDTSAVNTLTADIATNKGLTFSSARFGLTFEDQSSSYGTVELISVQVELNARILGGSNEADDRRDSAELAKIKYFYSGGAGLTASWDNGAIEHGHDAHRDLLQRFAGTPSADPTNWSGFHADRNQTAWKTRFWQLEPTLLKETLDKIAYEFGFNWKIDASGTLKYINVVQTGEYNTLRTAGSILNLTGNDINKVNISTTGLDNVVSKMKINYKKHPAEEKYIENITLTNDTSRAKYNHGEKEAIQEVNLDYNVGTPSANADPNNNFYAYQNNLIGDMKIIIECDVVNCAKGYQLETGDVVTFTDMPVEMFGTDFSTSTYFMIVELKRSLGKVSITAREVG